MNMNSTEAERFEKGKSICELYATRRFRQEDLASILCMSLFDVRKTLKLFNFEHTIQKTPDNSRPHQMVNICVIKRKHTCHLLFTFLPCIVLRLQFLSVDARSSDLMCSFLPS